MRFYIILYWRIKVLLIVRMHDGIILRVHDVKIINPLHLIKSSFLGNCFGPLGKSGLVEQIRVSEFLRMKQFRFSQS